MPNDVVPSEVTPENTSVPAEAAPETTQAAAPEVTPGETPPAEGEPEYTPDLKYKVYDTEKEIPEWARQYLNKESEKLFKDLFSKADALDPMKEKLKTVHTERESLQTEYQDLNSKIDTLRGYVRVGDFDSFFQGLNIPEKMIFKWVQDKIKYQDMSPDQRAEYDNALALKRRNLELERTSQRVTQENSQVTGQARARELDFELAKPEVNALMQEFDRASGKVGAFRQEVIARGIAHFAQTGKDMTAEQAVGEVLRVLKVFKPGVTPTPETPEPKTPEQSTKPVLPQVKGKSVSPAKKAVRSLDDLKKLAAQFQQ